MNDTLRAPTAPAASFRPHLTVPNAVTAGCLLCGLAALHLAARPAAAAWIAAAAVLDGIDGPLARRAGLDGQFGANLDSLADLVAFGVAPAALLYAACCRRGVPPAGAALLAAGWVLCAAARLARFGTLGHGTTFAGCPVPLAAVAVLPAVLLAPGMALAAAATALPALMISSAPFPSWSGLARAVRR